MPDMILRNIINEISDRASGMEETRAITPGRSLMVWMMSKLMSKRRKKHSAAS